MNKAAKFIIAIVILLTPFFSFAQCKDSLLIPDPYHQCYGIDGDFNPVCGCDGNTYRNECSAKYKGGLVYQAWNSGPCTSFDFTIDPTFVTDNFELQIFTKNDLNIKISIYDIYGHIYYLQQFFIPATSINSPYKKPIEAVSNFNHGIYVFVINSDQGQQVKKFFKSSMN